MAARQIRVECEAINPRMPLEFLCVTTGGNEHEAVLRTRAKPSNIHTALLMLGLKPGQPAHYSEAAKKWFPPEGPPITVSLEYMKDGKAVHVPASRFMRDLRTKKTAPMMSWIFVGSKIMPDGVYAADVTGYVVSIANFELTLLDVPKIASEAQETLEFEGDPDQVPPMGTPVTMIFQPMDNAAMPTPNIAPTGTSATQPSAQMSDVKIDQQQVDRLKQRWEREVKPHAGALQQAAQAQYEVLASLRREQQRLVDEADRIQRLIDQMEQDWQQLTTPRPSRSNE